MLTDRIKEMIAQAQIVSFANWTSAHPPQAIEIFQAADDSRVYLTDEDCDRIIKLSPHSADLMPISVLLRDRASEIVDEARAGVLQQFPAITEPGGGLYPPERAAACWRDFWHYLRPISYAIAGGQTQYTSAEGLASMHRLYQELQVPLDAMGVGLDGIKSASLQRIDRSQHAIVIPYFDHLINHLKSFMA